VNRVVHFEIQADDPERAARFYRAAFNWTIDKWPSPDMEYWTVVTSPAGGKEPGIDGGLLRRPAAAPQQQSGANAYVCTVQVEDFDETARAIDRAGGIVAMPKFALPGMAWQGYFVDTEGNTFGVHQPDENAR